jgi:hypothetical protein
MITHLQEKIVHRCCHGKFDGAISNFLMVAITGLTKSAQNEILYFEGGETS